jgi:mannitol-1-phosphate 5-dehydrogenase
MKKILIYGAGAIGRGYLPWVFQPDLFKYYFVESNENIRNLLNKNKKYDSYMTLENEYIHREINIEFCYKPGDEINFINDFDAILIAVGPRNFSGLIDNFIGSTMPIICFENDSSLSEIMRKRTGNSNVVFGIPDVITSNTASKKFLIKDELSIITENGECFVNQKVKQLGGDCKYISSVEMDKQWKAKLYIHNSTHCIAAYFGNLIGAKYLHNSMESKEIYKIVEDAMSEIKKMLKIKYKIEDEFLNFYANKELKRFSNTLLCDPISRVAREPFRKLAKNERLIGAATLCLSVGIVPLNIIKGIMAAFCFENEEDNDFYIKHLIRSLEKEDFLKIIIGLREDEALFQIITENWTTNINKINILKNEK